MMTKPDPNLATRHVYDQTASSYVEHVGTRISDKYETLADQTILAAFAETVLAKNPRTVETVLDAGSGVGRATRFLANKGLDISGVDLSTSMVIEARKANPHLHFQVGLLNDLPLPDRSQAAVCYWYSIIHTSMDDLAKVWAELNRVLIPGGDVLIAFQSGANDRIELPNAHGTDQTLTSYLHDTNAVAASLTKAGMQVHTTVVREPELVHETSRQSFISARRPITEKSDAERAHA